MYISEQMDRKKRPTFPSLKEPGQKPRDGTWTTNSDLVEDLLKETKQA